MDKVCLFSQLAPVFPSPYQPHTHLTLKNLLLVPSITKNLMSVSKFFRDNNVYFLFNADTCYVKSQVSGDILLQGSVGSDGLYEFPNVQLSSSAKSASLFPCFSANKTDVPSANSTSIESNLPNVWHLRLGHPNLQNLKHVLQSCNIPFSNKDQSLFCTACCMGKAHCLHSSASHTTYTTPLELV